MVDQPKSSYDLCASALKEIACHQATVDQQLTDIKTNVAKISTAVLGNGNPKNSLSSRVTALETTSKIIRRSGDRFLKIMTVVASVAAVVVAVIAILITTK